MATVLLFALVLLLAVLLSDLAYRSILSTAVLFLVVGFACGSGGLGIIQLDPDTPAVRILADLALFSILFTDGMRVKLAELVASWRPPGRALLLGLPLTLLGTALAAHTIAGLSWIEALLVGAALSPTDPVFAAAIVGRKEIPSRLRRMLNVESGLNDGLALPLVLYFLALLGSGNAHVASLGWEVLWGIILGGAVPIIALRLARRSVFGVHESHQTLGAFAIAMLIFALCGLTHGNSYLAAFTAGIVLVALRPEIRRSFQPFGEPLTELLKLAALLVFGAVISPRIFESMTAADWAFALVALFLVRPVAIGLSFLGSSLPLREILVAGWFGPKGFASVIYGIFVLESHVPNSQHLAHLIAIVVIGSMIAHSSTDVLIAQWFRRRQTPTPVP
jgi:NhaP-type Na+/H+ or K+/H+ antiporter